MQGEVAYLPCRCESEAACSTFWCLSFPMCQRGPYMPAPPGCALGAPTALPQRRGRGRGRLSCHPPLYFIDVSRRTQAVCQALGVEQEAQLLPSSVALISGKIWGVRLQGSVLLWVVYGWGVTDLGSPGQPSWGMTLQRAGHAARLEATVSRLSHSAHLAWGEPCPGFSSALPAFLTGVVIF